MHPWFRWMNETRATLAALAPDPDLPPADRDFLDHHYKANKPAVVPLARDWAAYDWTLERLAQHCGERIIEFQAGRAADPEYEPHTPALATKGTFREFRDRLLHGVENDTYIVSYNHRSNRDVFAELYADIGTLPSFVAQQPGTAPFWIGNQCLTPLHHDVMNSLLCQVVGTKHFRLVTPDQFDRIDHRHGLQSNLSNHGWLSDEDAQKRGIACQDFVIHAGEALFLPVGWWHCVRTYEPSITAAFGRFRWDQRNWCGSRFEALMLSNRQ